MSIRPARMPDRALLYSELVLAHKDQIISNRSRGKPAPILAAAMLPAYLKSVVAASSAGCICCGLCLLILILVFFTLPDADDIENTGNPSAPHTL